jgi:hypothetical protein
VKKSGKKRVGRPPGRKAPRRPVLSARVPEDFYEEIKAAAQRSGRTMSEEIVWRARQTIHIQVVPANHYYDADGRLVPYPSDPNEPINSPHLQRLLDDSRVGNIREVMRAEGFTQIHDLLGNYWAEPGVAAAPLKEMLAREIKAALKETVREVLIETKLVEE